MLTQSAALVLLFGTFFREHNRLADVLAGQTLRAKRSVRVSSVVPKRNDIQSRVLLGMAATAGNQCHHKKELHPMAQPLQDLVAAEKMLSDGKCNACKMVSGTDD